MRAGDVIEKGIEACADCGQPHDCICLEINGHGDPKRVSWARDGHSYHRDASDKMRNKLWRVAWAAKGLCSGTDWNKGTQAITHGYRAELVKAVGELFKSFSHEH